MKYLWDGFAHECTKRVKLGIFFIIIILFSYAGLAGCSVGIYDIYPFSSRIQMGTELDGGYVLNLKLKDAEGLTGRDR
jgi:hypothetical protein